MFPPPLLSRQEPPALSVGLRVVRSHRWPRFLKYSLSRRGRPEVTCVGGKTSSSPTSPHPSCCCCLSSAVEVEDLMENDITSDHYPSAPPPASPPQKWVSHQPAGSPFTFRSPDGHQVHISTVRRVWPAGFKNTPATFNPDAKSRR